MMTFINSKTVQVYCLDNSAARGMLNARGLWVLCLLVSIFPSSAMDECPNLLVTSNMQGKYVSGGWTEDCQPHYISYESCRQLLLHSNCNAAFYVNQVCHLLDRGNKGFAFVQIQNQEIRAVFIRKMTPSLDKCQTNISNPPPSALRDFIKCTRNEYAPFLPANFNVLPRLRIVISATASWVNRNPSEFAKVHNYMNPVP
jgi:hypothetical protein